MRPLMPLAQANPRSDSDQHLHKALLALHAATELESLWRAVNRLLRSALPLHRVTLFLGHLGMGEARFVRTDPPIPNLNEWYTARGRQNPFSPFIDSHPGVRFYRFKDLLPPREHFVRTEFYRNFARLEGWDKGLSLLFWEKGSIRAICSLYRGPHQPEFSEEELALVHRLSPFVETAVMRVQKLHTERLARSNLEEFAWNIPVGLVLLDWDFRMEFANPEARRLCAEWNHGPQVARSFNARDILALPIPIMQACERLRAGILARNAKEQNPKPGDVARVERPGVPGSHAQISLLNKVGSDLARPRFLVVLDERPNSLPELPLAKPAWLARLPALTPSERKIVEQLGSGKSNAEIARDLNKSILTVKTQLNSVFKKLGVRSRTRLLAFLASSSAQAQA